MAENESWARVSFQIRTTVPPPESLQARLTHRIPPTGGDIWIYTCKNDRDQTLGEQIEELDGFLTGVMFSLKEVKSATMDVLASWTPVQPQDGVVFPAAFLARLSELSADLLIDTYVDD